MGAMPRGAADLSPILYFTPNGTPHPEPRTVDGHLEYQIQAATCRRAIAAVQQQKAQWNQPIRTIKQNDVQSGRLTATFRGVFVPEPDGGPPR